MDSDVYSTQTCRYFSDSDETWCAKDDVGEEKTWYVPPPPPTVDPNTGMECSMDGYVNLVQQLLNVVLVGLSLAKQLGAAFLPADLRTAVDYAWKGVTGMGNWLGYGLAAGYFAAEEFGFGETFCMIMGYLNIALEYANMAVNMIDGLVEMLAPAEEAAEEEAPAE